MKQAQSLGMTFQRDTAKGQGRAPPKPPKAPTLQRGGGEPEGGVGARTAWMLGLAGLIPFFLPAAALWAGPQRFGQVVYLAPVALLAYGATIVSFLGGVRWGAEMGRAGGPWPIVLALSTAPQVLAWLAIVAPIPTVWRWGALILLLAVLGAVDAGSPDLPAWYRRMRIPLSVGAVVALFSGLAWTIVLANSLAHAKGG